MPTSQTVKNSKENVCTKDPGIEMSLLILKLGRNQCFQLDHSVANSKWHKVRDAGGGSI